MPTKFHENIPIGSKDDGGADRPKHRQDGDLIGLFPFLESRLKGIVICKVL
jgi:hypothetical protein